MKSNLPLVLALAIAIVSLAVPRALVAQTPPPFIAHPDLEYASPDGVPLRLDLYLPADGEGPFPVLVWIHGGGWREGSKDLPLNSPVLRQTSRGYAVASIHYRLSQEAIFPAQIRDCKGAVRWLRANADTYRLDADRIAVWGSSAGGHLASLLGVSGGDDYLEGDVGGNLEYSSRVQAVVSLYGIANFQTLSAQALPCSEFDHDAPGSPESDLFGCTIPACPDQARLASPVTYVDADDPPFLLLHGTNDCTSPPLQSREFYDAFLAAGANATLYILEGAGHGGPQFAAPATINLMQRFFDEHLVAPPPDEEPPAVEGVMVKNGAKKVRRGATVDVTWAASDAVGVASQAVELSLDGGATYQLLASDLPGDARAFVWSVSPDLPKSRLALVRVRASDPAGNEGTAASATFKLK